MQHYYVEGPVSVVSLQTNYPHTPADTNLSLQDYLEDKLGSGYEVVSCDLEANGYRVVFRVVAK